MNYSIIIPHFNVPILLQRCIDSIPVRDDLEIIVVDDNSNPEIVDFDNFPGKNRTDVITVFDKKGGGAGYARNIGISKAKGHWLLFADSDDIFNDNFLFVLDKYLYSDYDLVYFSVNGINEVTKKKSYRNYIYDIQYEYAKRKNDLYLFYYSIFQPWGKMIRSDVVRKNSIIFEEIYVSNDRMFSIKIAYYSKRICYDDSKIYTSFNRPKSLVTLNDANFEWIRLQSDIRVSEFLIRNGCGRYHINVYFMIFFRCRRYGVLFLIKSLFQTVKKLGFLIFVKDLYYFFYRELPYRFYIKKHLKECLN